MAKPLRLCASALLTSCEERSDNRRRCDKHRQVLIPLDRLRILTGPILTEKKNQVKSYHFNTGREFEIHYYLLSELLYLILFKDRRTANEASELASQGLLHRLDEPLSHPGIDLDHLVNFVTPADADKDVFLLGHAGAPHHPGVLFRFCNQCHTFNPRRGGCSNKKPCQRRLPGGSSPKAPQSVGSKRKAPGTGGAEDDDGDHSEASLADPGDSPGSARRPLKRTHFTTLRALEFREYLHVQDRQLLQGRVGRAAIDATCSLALISPAVHQWQQQPPQQQHLHCNLLLPFGQELFAAVDFSFPQVCEVRQLVQHLITAVNSAIQEMLSNQGVGPALLTSDQVQVYAMDGTPLSDRKPVDLPVRLMVRSADRTMFVTSREIDAELRPKFLRSRGLDSGSPSHVYSHMVSTQDALQSLSDSDCIDAATDDGSTPGSITHAQARPLPTQEPCDMMDSYDGPDDPNHPYYHKQHYAVSLPLLSAFGFSPPSAAAAAVAASNMWPVAPEPLPPPVDGLWGSSGRMQDEDKSDEDGDFDGVGGPLLNPHFDPMLGVHDGLDSLEGGGFSDAMVWHNGSSTDNAVSQSHASPSGAAAPSPAVKVVFEVESSPPLHPQPATTGVSVLNSESPKPPVIAAADDPVTVDTEAGELGFAPNAAAAAAAAPDDVFSLLQAYLWCLFLGMLGAHHFYLQRRSWGVVYLCTLALVGVGLVWDLFRLPKLVSQANESWHSQQFRRLLPAE